MIIEMLKKAKGSENGIKVEVFEAGRTYNVCEKLAQAFIESGLARTKKTVENKAVRSSNISASSQAGSQPDTGNGE